MSEMFAFIEAEKTTHGVAFLCRLLNVARSSFYAWLASAKTGDARKAADDASDQLEEAATQTFEEHPDAPVIRSFPGLVHRAPDVLARAVRATDDLAGIALLSDLFSEGI
ncbi:hypothetical protein AB0G85_37260 [Streptomyces sioyaensis]|uniref:hypothetical protein n=1 Tax=Streptomyces sioyaensis TaxID=67364 RepID=UPI0033D08B44